MKKLCWLALSMAPWLADGACQSFCMDSTCFALSGSPYLECDSCKGTEMCQRGKQGFSKGAPSVSSQRFCDVVKAEDDPCCLKSSVSAQNDCQGTQGGPRLLVVAVGVVAGLLSLAAWIYCRRDTFRRFTGSATSQQVGRAVPAAEPAQIEMAQAMPMPVAAPAQQMTLLSVACPPDAGPGSMIMVQGPAGQMQVQVPAGVGPGQTFQFQAPAAPRGVAVAQPIAHACGQTAHGAPVVMGVPMG